MGTSNIKLKHKVQLRRKSEVQDSVQETWQSPEQIVQNTSHDKLSQSKSTIWIWLVPTILIICGTVILWYTKFSNHAEETPTEVMATNESEASEIDTSHEFSDEGGMQQDDNPLPTVEEAETPTAAIESNPFPSDSQDPIPTEENTTPVEMPEESPSSPSVEPIGSANEPHAEVSTFFDVETEAMKVIRGDYGVGLERKDKLGSRYQIIQDRVNELKREGVF